MHRVVGGVVAVAIVLLASLTLAPAQPSVTAPRAALGDGGDCDALLFAKAPDSRALQGSIAKLMSAYVTEWAVHNGHAKWSDKVVLTKHDTQQACSCMKFGVTLQGSGSNAQCVSASTTQVGETFELRQLLQETLNQSTGESVDAIAEHIAAKVYGLPAANTDNESQHLLNLFVGLMNARAKELKLDKSLWITVHGGDTCDFSNGCDPHCTPTACDLTKCAFNAQCGGGTTVRDLERLWTALSQEDPELVTLIGARAIALKQDNASHSFYNSYGHYYGWYPGLDAEKNGSSGACPSGSCWLAQATRAGHTLIGVVLQSFKPPPAGSKNPISTSTQDLVAMFQWGYGKVLAPIRTAETTFASAVVDHALACNLGMCFSALRMPGDTLELVAWNAAPIGSVLAQIATFTGTAGKGAYGSVSSVDITANQSGTIVAMSTAGKIVLGLWWMTGNSQHAQIEFRGDSGALAGSGTLARVRLISDDVAVSAARRADGSVGLSSWKLTGTASHPLAHLADGTAAAMPNLGTTGELAIDGAHDPGSKSDFVVVTATVTPAGNAALQSWRVTAAGAFTYLATTSLGTGHNVALASDGVGKVGVALTTGTSTTGPLRVVTYDVRHDGSFVSTTDFTQSATAGDVPTETAIAQLGEPASKSDIVQPVTEPQNTDTFGASCGSNSKPSTPISQTTAASYVAAEVRPSGAKLAVWDAPVYYNESAATLANFRLADSGTAWGKAQHVRLAAITNADPLLSQYVVEEQRADGTLRLTGWHVGKASRSCPQIAPCGGTDFATDEHNCGSCGHACSANEKCTGGRCACLADVRTDKKNCGSCGRVCPLDCIEGRCCEACHCSGPGPKNGQTHPGVCSGTHACEASCAGAGPRPFGEP